MAVFHIHNNFHLGDQIFNMIFFYNIKYFLERKGIHIRYYCPPEHLHQVIEFKSSNNVHILPLSQKPPNSFHMWIENNKLKCTFQRVKNKYGKVRYNFFFIRFFNYILRDIFKSFIRLKKFYYHDINLLHRYENMEDKFKNVDILFLNSQPCSGQYHYNKGEWDNYIRDLHGKYKIVTTTHVEDYIPCTMHNQLTVKNIAAISTHAKIIIAINSGVVPGLLNSFTLRNVRQFYTFDRLCIYTYPNFRAIDNIYQISHDELNRIIH